MVTKEIESAQEIRQILQAHLSYLQQAFGVRRLALFGSAVKGSWHSGSDVDLYIELDRPLGLRFVELVLYLEEILGRPVDVLTPVGLETIPYSEVRQDIEEHLEDVQAK